MGAGIPKGRNQNEGFHEAHKQWELWRRAGPLSYSAQKYSWKLGNRNTDDTYNRGSPTSEPARGRPFPKHVLHTIGMSSFFDSLLSLRDDSGFLLGCSGFRPRRIQ